MIWTVIDTYLSHLPSEYCYTSYKQEVEGNSSFGQLDLSHELTMVRNLLVLSVPFFEKNVTGLLWCSIKQ